MPSADSSQAIRSLWAATADPAPALPRLKGERQADVAIIGGGYTGLSAAHYLAEAGLAPLVLEAGQIGWGASGRNGGVVSAKFRLSFPAIDAAHGRDMARRMHEIAQESVDCVEELVDSFAIAGARFARTGNLKVAHNERSLAAATAEAEWLRAALGDRSVSVLSKDAVREETGSAAFVGGVLTEGVGCLHPLNYVRGLTSGLAGRGVPIFEGSPAVALRRERDGILVETPDGLVRAKQAIVATNAYSDLTPATRAFQRRLVPFRSAIIATAPLSANLAATLLTARRTYGETRRMMRWFRMVDDRVVFGGRGAFGKQDSEAAFRALHRALVGLFPVLAEQPLDYRWSGLVAMTLDSLPHVGRLDERLLFALGYNGAGVAAASLMGRYLARFAKGESPDVGLLAAARSRPVPLYPLREPAVRLVAGWYQFLDAIGR